MADDRESLKNRLSATGNMSRHVMPLGPQVCVRIIPAEDRSSGGLFLPAGAKDAVAQAAYGEVVEVARAGEGFGENLSGVPEGSKVLFAKDRGLPVPWDEELRVLDVKDVVAIVDEIEKEIVN